jgi:hypothetical protein
MTGSVTARFRTAAYIGVLVVLVGVLVGRSGVPLYDGIGFPDEPYRYVQPPHGYHQKYQPTDARSTVPTRKGTNPAEGLISSGESGPQVALYIPPDGLHVVDATASVAVRARPVPATAPPTDGTLNSNVYDVDFGSAPVTFDPKDPSPPNIALREAVFQTVLAVMEYRPQGGAWRRLPTQQVGRDIYLGYLQGAGQYVLVQPGTGTPQTSRDSGSGRQLVFILVFCALVVTAALFAVRRTAGRESPEARP